MTLVEGAASAFPAQGKAGAVAVAGAGRGRLCRVFRAAAPAQAAGGARACPPRDLHQRAARDGAAPGGVGSGAGRHRGRGEARVDKFGEFSLAALAPAVAGAGCLRRWIMKRTLVSLRQPQATSSCWPPGRPRRANAPSPDTQTFLADWDGSLGSLSAGILAGTSPGGGVSGISSTTPAQAHPCHLLF